MSTSEATNGNGDTDNAGTDSSPAVQEKMPQDLRIAAYGEKQNASLMAHYAEQIGRWSHRILCAPIQTDDSTEAESEEESLQLPPDWLRDVDRGIDDAALLLLEAQKDPDALTVEQAQEQTRGRIFTMAAREGGGPYASGVGTLMHIFPPETWTEGMFNAALQAAGTTQTLALFETYREIHPSLDALRVRTLNEVTLAYYAVHNLEKALEIEEICVGRTAGSLHKRALEIMTESGTADAVAFLSRLPHGGHRKPPVGRESRLIIEALSKKLHERGRFVESLRVLRVLPTSHWDNILAHRVVMNFVDLGKFEIALQWIEWWKARAGHLDEYFIDALAICCNATGRPEEAKKHIEDYFLLQKTNRKKWRLLMRLVESDVLCGAIPADEIRFETLLERFDPEQRKEEVHSKIFYLLVRHQKWEEIIRGFSQCPEAMQCCGIVASYITALHAAGRDAEAHAWLQGYRGSWNDLLRSTVAKVAIALGKHAEAMRILDDHSELRTNFHETHRYLLSAAHEGKILEALDGPLKHLLTCHGKTASVWVGALLERRMHGEALEFLRRYREKKDIILINTEAHILNELSRWEEAIGILEKIPCEQWDAASHSIHAWASIRLRKPAQARESLERLRRERPHLWDDGLTMAYADCLQLLGEARQAHAFLSSLPAEDEEARRRIRYMRAQLILHTFSLDASDRKEIEELIPAAERLACPIHSFNTVCRALMIQKKLTETEALFAARDRGEWNAQTYGLAIDLSLRQQEYEAALALYAACDARTNVEVNPGIHFLAATAHALLGNAAEEERILGMPETAACPQSSFFLAQHFLRCKKTERALPHIRRMMERRVIHYVSSLGFLAWCANLGNEEARSLLETLLTDAERKRNIPHGQIARLRQWMQRDRTVGAMTDEESILVEDPMEPLMDFVDGSAESLENSDSPATHGKPPAVLPGEQATQTAGTEAAQPPKNPHLASIEESVLLCTDIGFALSVRSDTDEKEMMEALYETALMLCKRRNVFVPSALAGASVQGEIMLHCNALLYQAKALASEPASATNTKSLKTLADFLEGIVHLYRRES